MPTPPFQIIAVDVSKDSLQIKTDSDSFFVDATPEGLVKLLKLIQKSNLLWSFVKPLAVTNGIS